MSTEKAMFRSAEVFGSAEGNTGGLVMVNPGSASFLPRAGAGADVTVSAGGTVTLGGPGTGRDPWGTNADHRWVEVDADSNQVARAERTKGLSGERAREAGFTAPALAEERVLRYRLAVQGRGHNGTDAYSAADTDGGPWGANVDYVWVEVDAEGNPVAEAARTEGLSATDKARSVFTAPVLTEERVLHYRLTVIGEGAATRGAVNRHRASATVQVTVRAGPALIGVAVTSAAQHYGIGKTVEATASFGEAVTVTGAPVLALDLGGVGREATFDRMNGTAELVFVYTVQEGDPEAGIGFPENPVSLPAGSVILTEMGEMAPGLGLAATAPAVRRMDGVRPALDGMEPPEVLGLTLKLIYNEALYEDSVPAAGAYEVTATSETATTDLPVTAVGVKGNTVTLTLARAPGISQMVTMVYTVPATNPLRDKAGNDAGELTESQKVKSVPTVSVGAVYPKVAPGLGDAEFRVTVSQAPASDLAVMLSFEQADEYLAETTATITIPAGQTSATRTFGIANDYTLASGALTATIAGVGGGYATGTGTDTLTFAITHPWARWEDQRVTESGRYQRAEATYQDSVRQFFIGGMHVHAGFATPETRIAVMNAIASHLPLLLALSTSSPFHGGRLTGLKSYRISAMAALPRTGLPPQLRGCEEFEQIVRTYKQMRAIEDASDLRWDIRPSAHYPTIELRICDICPKVEDAIAIAALYACLIRRAATQIENGHVPGRKQAVVRDRRGRARRVAGKRRRAAARRTRPRPRLEHRLDSRGRACARGKRVRETAHTRRQRTRADPRHDRDHDDADTRRARHAHRRAHRRGDRRGGIEPRHSGRKRRPHPKRRRRDARRGLTRSSLGPDHRTGTGRGNAHGARHRSARRDAQARDGPQPGRTLLHHRNHLCHRAVRARGGRHVRSTMRRRKRKSKRTRGAARGEARGHTRRCHGRGVPRARRTPRAPAQKGAGKSMGGSGRASDEGHRRRLRPRPTTRRESWMGTARSVHIRLIQAPRCEARPRTRISHPEHSRDRHGSVQGAMARGLHRRAGSRR